MKSSSGRSPWSVDVRALAVAALLLSALAGCSAPPRAEQPTNLVLITLDTVRADHLGAYGWAAAETPVLDRLAAEGLRFDQASSPVPLTLPSHASLLSGLLPPRHGLRDNGTGAFPEDRATLASALGAAGWRTGAFVGAFVLDRRYGLARGFEVYDDEVERGPGAATPTGGGGEAERTADRVVDRAVAWLEHLGREDDRPFFLWVHLYDAHAPYAPPARLAARHPGRPYDGEIAFVDEQVGRLLAELARRGLSDSTAVAVAADHGEALGEHGEPTHGLFLYEATLRVPLLLRAPGLGAGRVVATPVSLVDLGPTLAGLLGQSLPAPPGGALDGRDLSAALARGEEPPRADLYAETRYPRLFGWSPLAALRRRDAKYIAAPRPELYDLARDPGETASLAAGRPEEIEGFAARLAELQETEVAAAPVAVDEETRARLAALGYAAPAGAGGTGGTRDPGTPLPDPKDMIDLFRRYEEAHWALLGGRAGEAAAELERLVAADPGNAVFRGELARALRERGQVSRALPIYRETVATAPGDVDAWYNLGIAAREAGRLDEAAAALEEALRLDPRRAEAANALGVVRLAAGEPEAAREAFARATALDGRDAVAWNNLGNVSRGLGRFDEAASAYRRATEVAPAFAEPWNGLGALEVARDRPAAALPLFERALELAPAQHEARLNRAIALEMMGDREAAAAAYRDFLTSAADDPAFVEQRRAARQLLARLTDSIAPGTEGRR